MATLTYSEAAHLLSRCGFGGPPEEIDDLAARGREGAVDYLINYNLIKNKQLDEVLARSFQPGKFFAPVDLERWWMTRMILSRRQFEEKLTLFWHNHFATSYTKVFYPLMYVQNKVLRKYALGRFDDLLLNVSKDAAMLIWLDGITNFVGRPNENFAREIQELFTMGIFDVVTGEPNYTEKDVKEIARCFTGWLFRIKNDNIYKPKFRFVPQLHDNGAKQVYGTTANFSGEDIITVISARRATARFLAKRFFEFFVHTLTESAQDRAIIEKFADVYVNSNHSIKELARAVFVSDEFFSPRARRALIKSPPELIAGAIRRLGASYESFINNEIDFNLAGRSGRMGMELFNPPDVSGWRMNLGWLNTARMLERFNFASFFASNRPGATPLPGPFLSNADLRRLTRPTAEETVENLLVVLGPLDLDADTKRALTDYLQTDDEGNPASFVVSDESVDKLVRGLLHLIMCSPEFQMN